MLTYEPVTNSAVFFKVQINREYTVAEYLTTVTDPDVRKALTMYRLSEFVNSLAIEKGRRREAWLSREDRLCAHCPQNEVELSCTS
jgi:hypothetical protein